jgi:hypothetical protein
MGFSLKSAFGAALAAMTSAQAVSAYEASNPQLGLVLAGLAVGLVLEAGRVSQKPPTNQGPASSQQSGVGFA